MELPRCNGDGQEESHGSQDIPAPAGEHPCHWVARGIQCQDEEKAPRKAARTIQALSQLLSEEHLSKLHIPSGERLSDGGRF